MGISKEREVRDDGQRMGKRKCEDREGWEVMG